MMGPTPPTRRGSAGRRAAQVEDRDDDDERTTAAPASTRRRARRTSGQAPPWGGGRCCAPAPAWGSPPWPPAGSRPAPRPRPAGASAPSAAGSSSRAAPRNRKRRRRARRARRPGVGRCTLGVCPAGGKHAPRTDLSYVLFTADSLPTNVDLFKNFQQCTKCRALFANDLGETGVCPAGGAHASGDPVRSSRCGRGRPSPGWTTPGTNVASAAACTTTPGATSGPARPAAGTSAAAPARGTRCSS